ncbi:hypothetical protein CDAR_427841 [Caerostris darwini]|uniref:Uncharacterized protein n=1 Tax=Caerostris darwini TaxID=1538125 RepID=A0AAV4QC52_9ARAC|nr:hypothetical protein CDAR_427841 [Caerostris darwini]
MSRTIILEKEKCCSRQVINVCNLLMGLLVFLSFWAREIIAVLELAKMESKSFIIKSISAVISLDDGGSSFQDVDIGERCIWGASQSSIKVEICGNLSRGRDF